MDFTRFRTTEIEVLIFIEIFVEFRTLCFIPVGFGFCNNEIKLFYLSPHLLLYYNPRCRRRLPPISLRRCTSLKIPPFYYFFTFPPFYHQVRTDPKNNSFLLDFFFFSFRFYGKVALVPMLEISFWRKREKKSISSSFGKRRVVWIIQRGVGGLVWRGQCPTSKDTCYEYDTLLSTFPT